jgi:hypothetical protein
MIYRSVTEHYANLVHVERWKLVLWAWMHYFGAPKLRSMHSTPLDPKWYMWALRSTPLTLCMYKYENLCFGPESTIAGYQSWEASILLGNISSGNQPLRANYGNFNLNHTILIQGRTHERREGWFAKFIGGGRDDLQRCFCKSFLPPPLSAPLDQHHVAQIEVSIVFTERMVSTWYVAILLHWTQNDIWECYGATH